MSPQTIHLMETILLELGRRGCLPKHMDISSYCGRYWTVCYDNPGSSVMNQNSFAGFSDSKEQSVLKALSEKIEREAFASGFNKNLASCLTDRSDGFAAMPIISESDSFKMARDNALNEAIERYVWATWWDDTSVAYDAKAVSEMALNQQSKSLLLEVRKQCDLEKIFLIAPHFEGATGKKVIILLGKLNSGGYISGGACGSVIFEEEIFKRSLDELYRHGLAVQKFKNEHIKPQSFYEERLCYFGLGLGSKLVEDRLEKNGRIAVQLPALKIDEIIPQALDDLYVVHRCYFENQPPFVGGKLERLCL